MFGGRNEIGSPQTSGREDTEIPFSGRHGVKKDKYDAGRYRKPDSIPDDWSFVVIQRRLWVLRVLHKGPKDDQTM